MPGNRTATPAIRRSARDESRDPNRDDAGPQSPCITNVLPVGSNAQAGAAPCTCCRLQCHSVGAVAAAVGATWGEAEGRLVTTQFLLGRPGSRAFAWNIKNLLRRVGAIGEIGSATVTCVLSLPCRIHGACDRSGSPLGPACHGCWPGQGRNERHRECCFSLTHSVPVTTQLKTLQLDRQRPHRTT